VTSQVAGDVEATEGLNKNMASFSPGRAIGHGRPGPTGHRRTGPDRHHLPGRRQPRGRGWRQQGREDRPSGPAITDRTRFPARPLHPPFVMQAIYGENAGAPSEGRPIPFSKGFLPEIADPHLFFVPCWNPARPGRRRGRSGMSEKSCKHTLAFRRMGRYDKADRQSLAIPRRVGIGCPGLADATKPPETAPATGPRR
jgi:hypothetical protein